MAKVCLERNKASSFRMFFLNLQASLSTAMGMSTKELSMMAVSAAKVRDKCVCDCKYKDI